jgi:hypothetical protein
VRSYRWEGTATAQSSIAHGGETLGTVTHLRRESFLLPDGRVEQVPVVSGNSWRGQFRRVGAELVWEALGCPELPLAVVATLWSGGALVKTGRDAMLSGARLARLRALVPQVMVLGGAGGGRILEGALSVGKLVPICQETAHAIPARYHRPPLPRLVDLVQDEEYSRVDDTTRPGATDRAAADDPARPEDLPAGEGRPDQPGGLLMRYGVETLAAGTRLHAWLALRDATAAQHAFLTDLLTRWAGPDGTAGHVGGRGRIGHGRVALDLTEQVVTDRGQHGEDPDWRGALVRHRDEALAALAALA